MFKNGIIVLADFVLGGIIWWLTLNVSIVIGVGWLVMYTLMIDDVKEMNEE